MVCQVDYTLHHNTVHILFLCFADRALHLSIIILVMKQLNTLNTELSPTCHLLALLGAHHILHVSRIRVNLQILVLY